MKVGHTSANTTQTAQALIATQHRLCLNFSSKLGQQHQVTIKIINEKNFRPQPY